MRDTLDIKKLSTTAQDPSAPTKIDHFQELDCQQLEASRHKK